ncbi:MAG: cyclase family protein [Clostridiales bacterium]|nr:cyclase family protein [Clostridiales bacterium]
MKGKPNVDEIPVKQLMGRAVNVDATATPPRGDYPLEELLAFEKNYGEIKKGDIVFFRFGWDEKYGIKPDGKAFNEDWPGISTQVGEYLAKKEVKAVGCDCLALDADGTDYPCHAILLGQDINIIENVARLGELPRFFSVIGLPCRFKEGSGSPIRLIAFLDDTRDKDC